MNNHKLNTTGKCTDGFRKEYDYYIELNWDKITNKIHLTLYESKECLQTNKIFFDLELKDCRTILNLFDDWMEDNKTKIQFKQEEIDKLELEIENKKRQLNILKEKG